MSDFMLESVTPLSAPWVTGRPAPVSAKPFCTAGLEMYLRKSTHWGGALYEQEKQSPPPRAAFGSPLPPATVGNANHPRLSPRPFLSSVSPAITAGSQWPMSSMAALPFATRPAELVAPCWAGVARKPSLNGSVLRKACRSLPAFVKHASANFLSTPACFITCVL